MEHEWHIIDIGDIDPQWSNFTYAWNQYDPSASLDGALGMHNAKNMPGPYIKFKTKEDALIFVLKYS